MGAEPRFPAIAITPQRANESTTPITVTSSACQKPIPKPST